MAGRKRESVGREVDELVASVDLAVASEAEVAAVAERIRARGQDAVERLARGILRPGPSRREKVTALLGCLRGEAAGWALDALRTLQFTRSLSPMERIWLSTTVRRLQEAASPAEQQLSGLAADAAATLSDPNELLLWRDELADLPHDAQQAVLAPVLDSGDPAYLPVLEMAMSLGSPALDATVAAGLARFATPQVLPLVRELLRRPSAEVRTRARETLLALARQGVDTREVFVATGGTDEGVALTLATPPDHTGRMAVLLARRRDLGTLDYAIVMVDPIELGIVDAWGDSGVTETELRERVADYGEEAGVQFDPIDLAVAQGIVAAAEAFARGEGHELPPDYVVWRRLVGLPSERPVLPVVFGPHCTECGTRLRREDAERGGLVAGEVALCAPCAAQPRHCVGCRRPLHRMFDQFLVRRGKDAVEFLCNACARSDKAR